MLGPFTAPLLPQGGRRCQLRQLSETLFYVAGGLLDKIWKAARRKEGEEGDCARRRHRKH